MVVPTVRCIVPTTTNAVAMSRDGRVWGNSFDLIYGVVIKGAITIQWKHIIICIGSIQRATLPYGTVVDSVPDDVHHHVTILYYLFIKYSPMCTRRSQP